MSNHEPSSTPGTPGQRPTAPAGPPVPDDRIHGDTLHDDGPYGDRWLRPTLTTERAEAPAESRPTGPQRPTTPSARRSWLVAGLGAGLLLSSISGVLTWDSITGGLWHSVDRQETYNHPAGDLTIQGGASDIEVQGGGQAGKVQVRRDLSWGPFSSEPTPLATLTGNTLELDAECEGFLGWCSVDFVVTVPDGTDVTVDNGSGDITLTGSFGGLTLNAGSGDVETRNIAAETIAGEVGSGDVDLDLGRAPSSVRFKTGSGDLSVRVPQDADYAVTADTGSGDAQVSIASDRSSTQRMFVTTGSGDIDIDYR